MGHCDVELCKNAGHSCLTCNYTPLGCENGAKYVEEASEEIKKIREKIELNTSKHNLYEQENDIITTENKKTLDEINELYVSDIIVQANLFLTNGDATSDIYKIIKKRLSDLNLIYDNIDKEVDIKNKINSIRFE